MAHGLKNFEIMIGSLLFIIGLGAVFCVDQTALNLNTQSAAFSYSNSQLANNQKTNLNIPNPSLSQPNINSNVTPSPISLSYSGSVVRNDNRQRPSGPTVGSVQPPVNTQARPGNVQFINTQTGSAAPTRPNPSTNPRPAQTNPTTSQYPALPSQQTSRIQPPTPPANPPRQNNPFPALPGQNPSRVQTLVNTFSGGQPPSNIPSPNPQNRPNVQPGRVQTLINTYSGQAGANNGANTPSPLTGGSRPFSYSGALKGNQPGASPLPPATGSNMRTASAADPHPKPPSETDTATDAELSELSEALLKKDVNNAAKYLTVNYQSKTTSRSVVDEAPLPLLTVNQSAYDITTIAKLRPLFNNYILETNTNEHVTAQERNEENALLDAMLSTSVMRHLMTFLQEKGKVTLDPKTHKDLLKGIWFNLYSRGGGKIGSSAFEHVFLSELKNGEISGLHNWVYFSEEEMANLVNYMGYIKKVELGQKGAILKLRFNRGTVSKPVNSMFIGTSPELEMALYTVCFVLRPDASCPLILAGNPITIRTYNFRYRGKNMIGSAFPEI